MEQYDKCLALMAIIDLQSGILEPGALKLAGDNSSWLADNQKKEYQKRSPLLLFIPRLNSQMKIGLKIIMNCLKIS
jgi:hypothetical protein